MLLNRVARNRIVYLINIGYLCTFLRRPRAKPHPHLNRYLRHCLCSSWLGYKTAETAAEQRVISLFCRSPRRQQPRISAENVMSSANDSAEKQQKQRERPSALRQSIAQQKFERLGEIDVRHAVAAGALDPRRLKYRKLGKALAPEAGGRGRHRHDPG